MSDFKGSGPVKAGEHKQRLVDLGRHRIERIIVCRTLTPLLKGPEENA
jgi:hypothetical protein